MSRSPAGVTVPVADSAAGQPSAVVVTSRALSVSAYFSGSGPVLPVIALTIFGVFLPALTVPYAFSDDYPVLSIADGLGSSPWFGKNIADTVAANGRPFAGLLDQLFFSAAGTIDNLRFVRLFAVVGIVALA